jgi:predicted outer membrane repeat protein
VEPSAAADVEPLGGGLVSVSQPLLAANTCLAGSEAEFDDCISGAATNGDTTEIQLTASFTDTDNNVIAAGKKIVITSGGSGPWTLTRATTTGFFLTVASGAELTLENLVIQGSTSTAANSALISNSGALTINDGATLQGQGGTFNISGAVYLLSNSTATMNGGTIQNMTDSNYGAAFNLGTNNNISLTINGGTIQNNTTTSHGSAIYTSNNNANANTITITGGTFQNNSAGTAGTVHGGVIYAAYNVAINISGGTFDGNSAYVSGGAIYLQGNATYRTTLGVTSGTFTNNSVTNGSGGNGGAIMLNGYADATITGNVQFTGNTSGVAGLTNKHGGAIYMNANNTLNVGSGVSFTNNTAYGFGGAIYATGAPSSVTINDATFSGNRSVPATGAAGGGALYLTGIGSASATGVIGVQNNTFTNNLAQPTADNAGANGGAVNISSAATYGTNATYTFANNALRENQALATGTGTAAGGGAYLSTPYLTTVSNNSIANNTATNPDNSRGSGGGLYDGWTLGDSPAGTTHVLAGNTITGNTSGGNGGGIFFNAAGSATAFLPIVISGSNISNNQALSGAAGGVRTANFTTLTLRSSNINNNTAGTTGGGLSLGNAVNLLIADDSSTININGNHAGGSGGGVYQGGNSNYTNATTVMTGTVSISGNTAGESGTNSNGGGFARANVGTTDDYTDSTFTINGNVTISDNTIEYGSNGGGGIWIQGMKGTGTIHWLTMEHNRVGTVNNNGSAGGGFFGGGSWVIGNSVVNDNQAPANGAGLYLSAGALTMTNSQVNDNTSTGASGRGGGIYIQGAGSDLTLTNTSVNGNTAAAHGGGVYSQASADTITLNGTTTITGNSGSWGGGLYTQGADTVVLITGNVQVKDNTASGIGGGLDVASGSSLEISGNAQISSNTAGTNGGGVYSNVSNTLITDNVVISGNESLNSVDAYTSGGGGVWATQLTISGNVIISGNSATGNGGGTYTTGSGSTLLIDGNVQILDNISGRHGGGVYGKAAVSQVITDNVVIAGNSAVRQGGGMWLSDVASQFSGAVQITDNTSDSDGGGIYINGVTPSVEISDTVSISGNTAGANGGGIWTAYDNLALLDVGADVVFSGNTAAQYESAVAPVDLPVYQAHVLKADSTWSSSPDGVFERGYNNYDIAYSAVKFNALFDSAGGSDVDAQVVYSGDTVIEPAVPTREGYVFQGWCVADCAPNGFKTIESVEFQGLDWIDTGIKTSDDLEVVLDYKFNSYDEGSSPDETTFIYGADINSPSSHFGLLQHWCGSLSVYFGENSLSAAGQTCADPAGFSTTNERITIRQAGGDFWYGDLQLFSGSDFTGGVTVPLNLYLGAMNRNGTAMGENAATAASFDVYGFRMYKNGELVANYLPMERESDGVQGFYDTVSKKFFARPANGGAYERQSVGDDGWTCEATDTVYDFATVPGNDVHLIAKWERAFYTVTFVDGVDSTVLASESVLHGDDATAPAPASHDCKVFSRWDVDFTNVSGNLTVTALYADDPACAANAEEPQTVTEPPGYVPPAETPGPAAPGGDDDSDGDVDDGDTDGDTGDDTIDDGEGDDGDATEPLAYTGSEASVLALPAFAALLAGAALVIRRRRK